MILPDNKHPKLLGWKLFDHSVFRRENDFTTFHGEWRFSGAVSATYKLTSWQTNMFDLVLYSYKYVCQKHHSCNQSYNPNKKWIKIGRKELGDWGCVSPGPLLIIGRGATLYHGFLICWVVPVFHVPVLSAHIQTLALANKADDWTSRL